jgi:L-alanine-DL-glutamate epimerase-like enolase superfamily enzyme
MNETRLPRLPDTPASSVAAIRTTVFRLPMVGTLRWGISSALEEVRHVLVEVELTDGATGMAEAPPRPTIYGETAQSICGIIAQELAPRVLNQTALEATTRLHEIANNHVAKGALDIALHDAAANQAGQTLAEHLQATRQKVTVSYILGIGDEETILAEAERVYAAGVRVFKVKVGRDWPQDLARIRLLQETLPPDLALYADANQCFTPDSARRHLDELRERGVLYCEEPLPIEHVHERAALKREAHLPLIADESCFTPQALRRELALDTFDVLNIKTPRTGYSDSLAMLAAARHAGKGIMIGSQACTGLGAAQAALFAARAEVDHPSEASFFLKLSDDIVTQPPTIHEGCISLADLAAVRVDRDRLREATVAF